MRILSINNKENDETRLQKILFRKAVQMRRVSADWLSVHFSVYVPYSSRQDALSSYALGGFWDESGRGVIPIDSAFSIPRFDMGETLGKNSCALVVLSSFGQLICVLDDIIGH